MSTSDGWDDFENPTSESTRGKHKQCSEEQDAKDGGCDWGQINDGDQSAQNKCQAGSSDSSKFIPLYEQYLNDKKSLARQTSNYKAYIRNPQKELREWFENEGHEFKLNVDQPSAGQFVCSIDLPIDDQDFTLTSESHTKKAAAADEVCLDACRMLDDCQLLYAEQSDQISQEEELARKRRITEANKEDDIVFDKTNDAKRHCVSTNSNASSSGTLGSKVNTYDSLMARWTELNMSILQSKAKLVKLDFSVTAKRQQATTKPSSTKRDSCSKVSSRSPGASNDSTNDRVKGTEEDEEIDPLDEFMSSLETKAKLSMDDKIEKSRLKAQIAAYERQQEGVARLLEVAKPSFDPDKFRLRVGGGGGGCSRGGSSNNN